MLVGTIFVCEGNFYRAFTVKVVDNVGMKFESSGSNRRCLTWEFDGLHQVGSCGAFGGPTPFVLI